MPKALVPALALVLMAGTAITGDFVVAAPLAPLPDAKAPIVLAANGCGRGMFRTIDGECIPNQPVGRNGRAPPPCPRGYLRDPDPARPLCYPAY